MFRANRNEYWHRVRTRTAFLFLGTIVTMGFASGVYSDVGKGHEQKLPRLRILEQAHLPLEEASGIALTGNVPGAVDLVVVGDHQARLVSARLDDEGFNSVVTVNFQDVIEDRLSPCGAGGLGRACQKANKQLASQWEALAVDGAGDVFLLQEYSHAVFVMSGDLKRVRTIINFPPAPMTTMLKTKGKGDPTTAEGFLLMKNGHLLIAREKAPVVLYEIGPAGDEALGVSPQTLLAPGETFARPQSDRAEFAILKTWELASHETCDVSEVAAASDGRVFVLSETCGTIRQIEGMTKESEAVTTAAAWRLPKRVIHPEGLAIAPDGAFLVVSDRHGMGPNIFRLAEE